MPAPVTCLIDDFGPLPLLQPGSVPELGALVRRAAAEGQAIYPLGGQTMTNLGLPPTRPGVGIDLRGLAQVIDYPARDMTVTVQAGITLAHLQELLGKENQRLPVDVPRASQATLGGVLATNVSGPRRYSFGTLRDYVIGITVVNDEGQEVKAGGRVVKNVAGYDLCKLYVGSLGTLGIIAQVTLKLRPIPEERALIVLPCASDRVGALLDQLHRSRTRPVCLDLLNAAAARYINREAGMNVAQAPSLPDAPWLVVIGFEDNRDAVCWQVQQLVKELSTELGEDGRGLDARVGVTSEPLWQALVEFADVAQVGQPEARLTFKANVLPSATAAFCSRADQLPDNLLLQAHAGNGIIVGHAGNDLTQERARTLIQRLREVLPTEGNIVIQRCPPAWKGSLPIWGNPRGDGWLMRTIKKNLDPRGLFNPGRFVESI
jgi:glycolate oxidase FAD binding subunit